MDTNAQYGKTMHAYDITVFTSSYFFSLHRDDNCIIKNKNAVVKFDGPENVSCF